MIYQVRDFPIEVQEAVDAIKAVYRYHPSGGLLHCIIDDGNVESLPTSADELASLHGPRRITKKTKERYQKCLDALWKLTIDGRELACNFVHGYADDWLIEHERNYGEFEPHEAVA